MHVVSCSFSHTLFLFSSCRASESQIPIGQVRDGRKIPGRGEKQDQYVDVFGQFLSQLRNISYQQTDQEPSFTLLPSKYEADQSTELLSEIGAFLEHMMETERQYLQHINMQYRDLHLDARDQVGIL
ncbi:hypothetical protein N7452_009344 [Penicillium brevicompactum]|uniref:DH domain-containing protein n=1 Tax=Penicillium brevicompactum TaxID=5074 RepID=A0A9W9UB46_PENBR|nr:hypothetical protein N7452_009344 [Penicillium brevicompactum]